MPAHRGPRIDATILGAASLLALALGGSADNLHAGTNSPPAVVTGGVTASELIGGWTSADGTVRLRVGSDGRFERSIEGRDAASKGTYRIDGLNLVLRDDSGLLTNAEIHDGVLDMAGRRLERD